jgi:hypothetical protein
VLFAAVIVCEVLINLNKYRSVTEAMMNNDVRLVSRVQYTAIETIKNREIEGYEQNEVSF